MISGDHHDLGRGKRGAQPRELEIRVQNRRVGRPHLMKDVAGDQDHLGRKLDHLVHCASERLHHVFFALIAPARSQPLVLAVSEVQVGEVDEAQTRRGERR